MIIIGIVMFLVGIIIGLIFGYELKCLVEFRKTLDKW